MVHRNLVFRRCCLTWFQVTRTALFSVRFAFAIVFSCRIAYILCVVKKKCQAAYCIRNREKNRLVKKNPGNFIWPLDQTNNSAVFQKYFISLFVVYGAQYIKIRHRRKLCSQWGNKIVQCIVSTGIQLERLIVLPCCVVLCPPFSRSHFFTFFSCFFSRAFFYALNSFWCVTEILPISTEKKQPFYYSLFQFISRFSWACRVNDYFYWLPPRLQCFQAILIVQLLS